MIFETLVVGSVFTNCYLIGCPETKAGIIVDPGGNAEAILDRISRVGMEPKYILNTHGHADHIEANGRMKKAFGIPIAVHAADAPMLTRAEGNLSTFMGPGFSSPPADMFLTEQDIITFGSLSCQVLHTPGHTPGSVSLVGDGYVLTGDALFANSIGRTDFPGGSHELLLESIRTKLFTLDPSLRVCPGHGPESTIGWEKVHNPFFSESFDVF